MQAKLLVVADDFTGALDTGIQFAKKGISTKIFINFNDVSLNEAGVIVVNTNTRHVAPEEAKRIVREITLRARQSGIGYFYKKTDSALRGNIGSELEGMLSAVEETQMHFVPAYPKMNRTTVGGIQYIEGIEVAKSIFGEDPFDAVKESNISKLIAMQSEIDVSVIDNIECPMVRGGIVIYDASTDTDIEKIAQKLKSKQSKVFAGCAGFAEHIAEIIDFDIETSKETKPYSSLFVVSASLNEKSILQIEYAKGNGFSVFTMDSEQKGNILFVGSGEYRELIKRIQLDIDQNEKVVLRSVENIEMFYAQNESDPDRLRVTIADNMGSIAAEILRTTDIVLFVIGGDLLQTVLVKLGITSVIPKKELFPGVVEFTISVDGCYKTIISKSGGFGDIECIVEVYKKISQKI